MPYQISEKDRNKLNNLYALLEKETTKKGLKIVQKIINLKIEKDYSI